MTNGAGITAVHPRERVFSQQARSSGPAEQKRYLGSVQLLCQGVVQALEQLANQRAATGWKAPGLVPELGSNVPPRRTASHERSTPELSFCRHRELSSESIHAWTG
jgi:hypothetical protein